MKILCHIMCEGEEKTRLQYVLYTNKQKKQQKGLSEEIFGTTAPHELTVV